MMLGVFDGLKVLDLSWGVAGPIATMLLADHGAQVTRIERPQGDPFPSLPGYKVWHRGKRSAVLDLKDPDDHDVFLRLAAGADILVESFSPGVMDRLGLGYDVLSAVNPRLIYVSITGYGKDTSIADRPGYDSLVMARTGLQFDQLGRVGGHLHYINGDPDYPLADLDTPEGVTDGPDREGPMFSASPWPSTSAAYLAAVGIGAALVARESTGRGQLVETSLLQGALAAGTGSLQRATNVDAPWFWTWVFDKRASKGFFQCADGRWIQHWVPNPKFVLGSSKGDTLEPAGVRPSEDPDRILTGPEDLIVYWHYLPQMRSAFAKFTSAQWVEAAREAGVCLQIVQSPAEALTDEHMLADGCVAVIDDPELGPLHQVGSVIRLDRSPGKPTTGAPRRGEHTAQVRAEAAAAPAASTSPPTATVTTGRAPLDGVLVIDLGLAIAGPYGTQLLSDLGATVIKVNTLWDGFWHSTHIAFAANRGKQSLSVNLKDPRGLEAVRRLIDSADIVQHNMRYGAAVRLGLDYDSVKTTNPEVIYCHTRGFDRGYREGQPGNDQTGAALAGLEWADGGMDDGGTPLWGLTSLGDTGNGFLSAFGMLQAYYDRLRTGKGQFVDTSILYACLLTASGTYVDADGVEADRPKLDKSLLGLSALHGLYETAAGWLTISALTDEHWTALTLVLGNDVFSTAPEFSDASGRRANDAVLRKELETILSTRTARAWRDAFDAAGVPAEVSDPDFSRHVFDDEELIARRWVTSYPQPLVGRFEQTGLGVDLSDTPGVIQGPPLTVGAQSREILASVLGYGDDDIEALVRGGVISQAQEVSATA
jgi:crotonobetainyl-CoA:carnitine CoA-transferase CaiB-like acyl-CoA transferase